MTDENPRELLGESREKNINIVKKKKREDDDLKRIKKNLFV
jgi:hypothetical protein